MLHDHHFKITDIERIDLNICTIKYFNCTCTVLFLNRFEKNSVGNRMKSHLSNINESYSNAFFSVCLSLRIYKMRSVCRCVYARAIQLTWHWLSFWSVPLLTEINCTSDHTVVKLHFTSNISVVHAFEWNEKKNCPFNFYNIGLKLGSFTKRIKEILNKTFN